VNSEKPTWMHRITRMNKIKNPVYPVHPCKLKAVNNE
jgi:hypothetical protein